HEDSRVSHSFSSFGRRRSSSAAPPNNVRSPQHRFRPFLERLEERALLSAGDLDPSFGSGGTGINNFSTIGASTGQDVVVQADGKVVLGVTASANTLPRFGLARFNTDGALDNAFGTNGQVLAFSPMNDQVGDGVAKLLLQPDGKILA